jgi:mono/diheme cytochrome c family protein
MVHLKLRVGKYYAAAAAESKPIDSYPMWQNFMDIQAASSSATERDEGGRYFVKISGCNDCHTPGYAEAGGKIPERDWLTGDSIGWRGPWGTTYASNLRLYMQYFSEDQWVTIAHTARFRPPMPWFALHDMTEQDLRAIYRFIRNMGPAGKPAPAYLPPEKEPQGPYILFPQTPK